MTRSADPASIGAMRLGSAWGRATSRRPSGRRWSPRRGAPLRTRRGTPARGPACGPMLHVHARVGRREPVREVAGPVGRAVVDDQQHGAGERLEDRRRDPGQVVGLVIGRQDHPAARPQRARGLGVARRGVSGSIVIVAPSSSGRECTGRYGVRRRPGPTASPVQAAAACRGRRSGSRPRRRRRPAP